MAVVLLFLGDDGPDVADEESRGPEGVADIPGEGCWGSWVLSWFCLLSVDSAQTLPELVPERCSMGPGVHTGLCRTSIPL